MPATTTYSEIYAQFKCDIGVGAQYSEDGELAARFNGWLNDRLREIWRAARWSQCVAVQPCVVSTDGVAVIPCVVDNGDKINLFAEDPRYNFRPTKAEFVLNDGWLWVGEKFASTLKPDSSAAFSGKSFTNCKTATLSKGDLFMQKQWSNLSSYFWRNYRYEGDAPIVMEEGSTVDENEIGTTWIDVSIPPFTPTLWLMYKSVSPKFDVNGIDTITNIEFAIPIFMKRYVQLSVHSDYLRSLNRPDEADKVFANAQAVMEEEVYKFETFSTKGEDIYGRC